LGLDRALVLERFEVPALLERALDQLGNRELLRLCLQRLHQRVERLHRFQRRRADTRLVRVAERLPQRDPLRVGERL
jgi:hypothetical protein